MRQAFLAAFAAGAVLSAAATAQAQVTSAQQSAMRSNCRSDFMSHCSGVTPGGKAALKCLQQNVDKLSGGCQTAVRATMPAPAPAAAAAKPAEPAPKAAEAPPAPPAPPPPAAAAGGGGAGGAGGASAALGAGSAGFAAAAAGAGAGMVARTAVWQPPESLSTFCWRHFSAALPPGVTPEQCDMKSERQFERIALCCALVTCACAVAAADSTAPAANAARKAGLIVHPPKFPAPLHGRRCASRC